MKKFLCFDQIMDTIKLDDKESLTFYLEEIYISLSNDDKERITLNKLTRYMNLPHFIGKKIYQTIDNNNSNKIDGFEFVEGILNLYSNDYFHLTKMYFDILDFTKEKKIYRQNVKIFLLNLKQIEDHKNLFEVVDEILSQTFQGKEFLFYTEFLDTIENVNSDILFILLIYFYQKQPFSDKLIKFIYGQPAETLNSKSFGFPKESHNKIACDSLIVPKVKNDIISLKRKGALGSSKNLHAKISQKILTQNKFSGKVVLLPREKKSDIAAGAEKMKNIIVAPSENIILFSSDGTYLQICDFVLKDEKLNKKETIVEEDVPDEFSTNHYIREVPKSLEFTISKPNRRSFLKKSSRLVTFNCQIEVFSFITFRNLRS
jgi:hypothetical protein